MICVNIQPYHQRTNWQATHRRLTSWWASLAYDVRLISRTRPLAVWRRSAVIRQSLTHGTNWQRPWLIDQHLQAEQWQKQTLRTVEHYLCLWPPARMREDVVLDALGPALGVAVRPVPFPAIIPGRYTAEHTYLKPHTPGMPYLAILSAYATSGTWDFASWQALLSLPLDLTLAIDIHTYQKYQAQTRITKVLQTLKGAFDTDSVAAREDAQGALGQLATQSVHDIAYTLLIAAESPHKLSEAEQQIALTMQRSIQFERVPGTQEHYAAFFQPETSRRITIPVVRKNTLSEGACKVPWFISKPDAITGPCVGTHAGEGVPVCYRLFGADGKQNASSFVLGQPGRGKTVFLLTLALRHLLDGFQVVCIDPADNFWRLREAIGDSNACAYHSFEQTPALNLLDPVSTEPAEQARHIIDALQVALGTLEEAGSRWQIRPRMLTAHERRIVARAMHHEALYGANCSKLQDATLNPRLEDFAAILIALGATDLAEDIDDQLIGLAGHIYNQPTRLHFDPSQACTIYNVRDVPLALLPLWYKRLFDEVHRHVQTRSTRRPFLLIADEWWVASSIDAMRSAGIRAAKTWRNYTAGIVTADQHTSVYFSQDASMPGLPGATRQKFFFQLEADGVDLLERAYPDIAGTLTQVRHLERGHCLALLDDVTYPLRIDLTAQEAQFFT